MNRRLDVINLDDPAQRPAPAMMGACESGGCGGGSEPLLPPPPTFGEVRVNGVEIPPESIAQEIQHHPAPDAETAWVEAARALAVRELLLQEARRRVLTAEPDTDEAGGKELEEDALVRALLEEDVAPAEPGEAECRRYYEANANRFRTPDLFEAAHILIEPEGQDDPAWRAALDRAAAIIADIGDDPAAFATAARTHSGCASAQQDGSLGQIRRGELVAEVQTGLEALGDGKTSHEPVRSKFGWHILRLHRRIPGRTLPFEMVRDRIADMLEARSWSIEAARYVASLAARNEVERRPDRGGRLMAILGDLLAAARDRSGDFQAWLERADPELAAQVVRAASAQGMTATGYVRSAMSDFNRYAAEEDWATLTSSLRDTDDPGTVCLLAMVHWRLTARGCSAHAQHDPAMAEQAR